MNDGYRSGGGLSILYESDGISNGDFGWEQWMDRPSCR
jgi:hypothetical protein